MWLMLGTLEDHRIWYVPLASVPFTILLCRPNTECLKFAMRKKHMPQGTGAEALITSLSIRRYFIKQCQGSGMPSTVE